MYFINLSVHFATIVIIVTSASKFSMINSNIDKTDAFMYYRHHSFLKNKKGGELLSITLKEQPLNSKRG